MAFRATRALRMVVTKTSTGLVGLKVDPNGRANFIALQKEVLDKVKILPEHYMYRKNVEQIFGYRLKVAEEIEDEETIENTIGRGQLEEMIQETHGELKLIDLHYEDKTWEAVAELLTPPEGVDVEGILDGTDEFEEPPEEQSVQKS